MNISKILAVPPVYSFFRHIVGSDDVRRKYANEYIRARDGDKVLDIGCGTGDILAFLPAVDYVGFDGSAQYIQLARKRFGSRGRFFHGLVGDTPDLPEPSFDIALAHGVLHHLDDDEAVALFDTAYKALKPGGRLLTFDGCYTDEQSALARYLVSKDRGQFVRDRQCYEALAHRIFPHVDVSIRNDLLRVPYTHIIMECTR